MILNFLKYSLSLCFLVGAWSPAMAQSSVVIGQDDWLFTRYEFAVPSDATDTQASIQMFSTINKLFQQKGVSMALVIVPSKIRIHADKLPVDRPVDAYTAGKYGRAVQSLQAGGVRVISLDEAFMQSPHRSSDTPLFLRLDTHWSPTGAFLAAKTIKAAIDQDATLSAAYQNTPEEKYSLVWREGKVGTRTRDLVKLLPKGSPTYAIEQIVPFKVSKVSEAGKSLIGDDNSTGITVIGSSYTNKNTGYPDALRFTLQRNLLDISLPVDQGPWYGMLSYLKDDAFKTKMPKLIIWEIPERELRSPPDNKYRDARYIIDNKEWVTAVTGLLK